MNFDFLKPFSDLRKLYEYCEEAEEFALSKPNISATSARKAMEFIVKMIYASVVREDYGFTVFEMVTDARFVGYVDDSTLINSIHFIRKMGNVAVHDGGLNKDDAMKILEELHFLVGEFCILLGLIEDYPEFEAPGTSTPAPVPSKPAEPEKKVEVTPELIAEFGPRMRKVKFDVRYQRNEAENKKLYLEACLREAGWPVVNTPNQPLPASAGIHMLLDDGSDVDYILYGRDNKPLAIVEYTETAKNPVAGRTKALKAAETLKNKFGYAPVVYYTNGYIITVIDQLGYPPRRVFQFHSIDELELLKARKGMRQDIFNPAIDDNITNRAYQKEAIRSTCKAFTDMRRRSLLVMATGTGKTRISISLVDVLMKAGWIKNVLFLADRTSLVRQAHKNYTKLLPSVTTSVYAGNAFDRDANARIIFSTYQTMINLINDDTREFGIGRFDLIVIDEAHRSIFNRYSVLFEYFDSLMIGLTATPRGDENKSTYDIFGLPNACPDYAYELEQAIAEGYLVGFNVQDKTTKAMRRGIHYDELTAEQKVKFEDSFGKYGEDEERINYRGTVIEASTVRTRKIINTGTIDVMLNDLMKNGLKVNAGDKLGKTIIFASSHVEAEVIVERFYALYANLGTDFCKLIDSHIAGNQALIDSFGEKDKYPQIAVSVDMMDTGIDVPEVLNLVFFKKVQAKIKFLQMVGRGTRLCPDVFGPGIDKRGFVIFDYYDNFNFFRAHNTWSTVDSRSNGVAGWGGSLSGTPQSVLIHQTMLEIYQRLANEPVLSAYDTQYRDELKALFVNTTQSLCNDDIGVQLDMAYVSKYRTAENWNNLPRKALAEIEKHILPLFPPIDGNVKSKNFDLMMYVIERDVPVRMLEFKDPMKVRHGFGNVFNKIDSMLNELLKLKTIPQIVAKEQLLNAMKGGAILFDPFTLEKCESVRKELRELMHFIPDKKQYHIIEATDVLFTENGGGVLSHEKSYTDKVQEFFVSANPVLAKISNLDPLADAEKATLREKLTVKLGTDADFAKLSQGKPMLVYVRSRVGITDSAVTTKLGAVLNDSSLTPHQAAFMRQMVDYARQNGDITAKDLMTVSPFCDIDISALFGEKFGLVKQLLDGIHKPVME